MGDVPHEGSPECMACSLWPSFDSSLEGLFTPKKVLLRLKTGAFFQLL
jgi:hypothetical protein